MAMRGLLRSAAGRPWRCRSAAPAHSCASVFPESQSDATSSSSSSSFSAKSSSSPFSSAVSQLSKPPLSECLARFSSLSASEMMRLSTLSSSFPSASSASGALRIPSHAFSFLISAPSAAPFSVCASGVNFSTSRSRADLRLGNLCGGGPQLGGDYSARSASMQQRRSLSKLKKYKIKSYSSYKERFKLMADGTYKRWRSGTRHNAHSKTAKQRRQLRRPSTAPAALAKVMKKLHFVR